MSRGVSRIAHLPFLKIPLPLPTAAGARCLPAHRRFFWLPWRNPTRGRETVWQMERFLGPVLSSRTDSGVPNRRMLSDLSPQVLPRSVHSRRGRELGSVQGPPAVGQMKVELATGWGPMRCVCCPWSQVWEAERWKLAHPCTDVVPAALSCIPLDSASRPRRAPSHGDLHSALPRPASCCPALGEGDQRGLLPQACLLEVSPLATLQ